MSSKNEMNTEIDIDLFASNLHYLMNHFKIDPLQLSKKTQIALTTLNNLRKGVGNPTLATLYQLAKFFNVSIGQLMEEDLSENLKKRQPINNIPLINMHDLSHFLLEKKYDEILSIDIDATKSKNCFALKINNHAMMPIFDKGTIFVIETKKLVQDGDIVLVQFGEYPACFRKVLLDQKNYLFKPISDFISGEIVKGHNFIIHGIVIKAIQHLNA